jgi:hypothetical protein
MIGSESDVRGHDNLACAPAFRAETVAPVGSIDGCDMHVLVEIPLPWPSDIAAHPCVAELASRPLRVQALVPGPGSTPRARRVIVYRRAGDLFRGFARTEVVSNDTELVRNIEAVLRDPAPQDGTDSGSVVDALVCSHGRRDRCCGSEGTRLVQALAPQPFTTARLWRTSHTGGHRYAPTALTFPDGYAWAYLSPETLSGIVTRRLPAREAARLTRGCSAFRGPWAQVADAEGLALFGWEWMSTDRRCATVDDVSERSGPDRRLVTFEFGAAQARLLVLVEATRTVSVPLCGGAGASGKSCTEYRVVEVATAGATGADVVAAGGSDG